MSSERSLELFLQHDTLEFATNSYTSVPALMWQKWSKLACFLDIKTVLKTHPKSRF